MEALEIEGQTDQSPLASGGFFPTQGELAEAEHVLDNANDWFDRAFADAIDSFAHGGGKLVSHLHFGTGLLRWGIAKPCEALFPTGVMGITTSCNVGVNTALATSIQGCRTKVARIQCCCQWSATGRGNRLKGGFGFMAVIGMVREGVSNNKQFGLIHSNLHIVSLLKSGIGGIFHDAGLGVSEVVLVPITWPWHGWGWWTTTRTLSRFLLPLDTLGHLGIILCLLGCCPLGGASLQHHFGLCQSFETRLSASDLITDHQSIGDLLRVFGERKEILDLGSKLGLHFQQTLITDRFVLGGIRMHLAAIQADIA